MAKGRLLLPDNGVYEGDFKNDLYDGYGKMSYADGGSYAGNFKLGKWQGTCLARSTRSG